MLTRSARHIAIMALLGCAGHAPAPALPLMACAGPDSLQVAVTPTIDSGVVAALTADAPSERACAGKRWTVVVHAIETRAARDALDAGIDVLLTEDPRAIAYVAGRSDYDSAPLPWDRMYLLALPGAVPADTARVGALRAELATRAVRADARPAETPVCGTVPTNAPARRRPVLAYEADDSTARALAERLVALADRPGAPVPPPLTLARRAEGRTLEALGAAFVGGDAVGYVLSRPIGRETAPCVDHAGTLIPLIETRPRAIVRRGAARIAADAAGAVHLERLP
jgi:hypothetical protein